MRPLTVATLLLCLTTQACANRDADRSASAASARETTTAGSRETLPPSAAVALDRANADFRAGRHAAALAGYRAAAAAAPEFPAPWFGVLMVAQVTRDSALADSARAAIRARSPNADLTSDAMTAAHTGAPASTRNQLPAGHGSIAPDSLPPGHPPLGRRAPMYPPRAVAPPATPRAN